MSYIRFKVNDEGKIRYVEYNGEISCEEFMLDFTKKYTDKVTTNPNVYIFKAGIKILNSQKYMYNKLKDMIINGYEVRFYRKKELDYCLCAFTINDNGIQITAEYGKDYDNETTIQEFMFNFTRKYTNYATTDPKRYLFEAKGEILNSPEFIYKKVMDLSDLLSSNVNFVRK